ncbi:amidohydrolase family protein [Sinorhizobium fredii]|uniref:Amidohydrolase 2 family protein n=1 Tax=Rhizobium fredii TaxID=380 RepID=A0A2L0HA45_RHIFR|nr:amidohydrolase family protein [Sinorhizobium fredii]AUX78345.1 amidohydrolase 2 family protein [Sinorhizobium fredii]
MTTTAFARPQTPEGGLDPIDVKVIDTDVHVEPRSFEELIDYMDAPWKDRTLKARVPFRRAGFTTFDVAGRMDAYPTTGDLGSDPDMVAGHLFQDDPIDYAILLPWSLRGFTVDPALDTALVKAVNQWLSETWLSKYNTENRYVGSISVSVEDPIGAVREIEKWAGHPGFRQVAISHYGPRPFGHPMYDPIWEAAARHGLPVSIHFKGGATQPLGWTSTGPLQYFVEYHSLIAPMAYATHMASFICNGVLDRHPGLQFLFLEGGFLWYRPFIDRMTRHWQKTGQEFSAAKTPQQYVLDHFRFATQPVEEATDPQHIATLFEEADAGDLLMFSSDYPHYDYDPPSKALPRALDDEAKKKIMAGNALDFFKLPKTRPADRFDRKEGRV